MAESFLSSVAGIVAEKKICLAWGARRKLERFEGVLGTIKPVLVDAEEKQWTNPQLRDWLGKLKNVCYDAEDVLDEFEYHALEDKVVSHGSIKRKVLHFFSSSNPLLFGFKMSHRIREITERLDEIAADKSKFMLASDVSRAPVLYREKTHSFVNASDVIGRDKDKENILQLLKNSCDMESISVIPIVGLGGLGKTTLAKLVYNDRCVVENFKKRMWVCISDDFDLKKVIVDIINSIKTTAEGGSGVGLLRHDELSMEQSRTLLRSTLGNEPFFLVLDDTWNEDRQKWIELKTVLMNGVKGNKIVVTTRSHRVASIMGTVPAYLLEGLSCDDCLSLFLKWAFKEGQERQHPKLVHIGKGIVAKCKGVPLAARTLGSLLFSNFEERYWAYVRDTEIWKLEQKECDILPALRLSYEQLPSYLKRCFAYCSIFPKDYNFNNVNLVNMWSSQGLIQQSEEEQDLEVIGGRYIEELLSRSFFQDLVQNWSYVNFKMHDLMHDLAAFVSRTECTLIDGVNPTIPGTVRHVSFSYEVDDEEILRVVGQLNGIRTLLFVVKGKTPHGEQFLNICNMSMFKCIKMLDLSNSDFDTLPSSIANLKLLRFLNLNLNKRIKKLPNSICKLFHLQTLLLRECNRLEKLPKEIGNLINLRYLAITTKQRDLGGIRHLESLRILLICQCENSEFLLQGMQTLTALRALHIESCSSLETLTPSMNQLRSLEFLRIWDCEKMKSLDGNGEQHIPGFRNLRVLQLKQLPKLEALPEWIRSHISLDALCIEECPQLTERWRQQTIGEDWCKISHVPNIYIDGIKIDLRYKKISHKQPLLYAS